jgi:hypothetical protein
MGTIIESIYTENLQHKLTEGCGEKSYISDFTNEWNL